MREKEFSQIFYAASKAMDAFKEGLEENAGNGEELSDDSEDIRKMANKIYEDYVLKEIPIPYRFFLKFESKYLIDEGAKFLKGLVKNRTAEEILKSVIKSYVKETLR